jgi:hypothetical protein
MHIYVRTFKHMQDWFKDFRYSSSVLEVWIDWSSDLFHVYSTAVIWPAYVYAAVCSLKMRTTILLPDIRL